MLPSARKHGIHDENTLHAYRKPVRVFELDDLSMLIGPARDASLLEVGVVEAQEIEFIVHAMVARAKFLR